MPTVLPMIDMNNKMVLTLELNAVINILKNINKITSFISDFNKHFSLIRPLFYINYCTETKILRNTLT